MIYTESGILWPIFFLVFAPNLIVLIFCVFITLLSGLAGYFLFLYRKKEQYKLYVVICRICLCLIISQYIALIIGLIGGFFFAGILGTEWPLYDPIQIAANNIYVLLIIIVSILIAFCSSYFWLLRKVISTDKARKQFCFFCSIISGWTLLPLHLLLRAYVA